MIQLFPIKDYFSPQNSGFCSVTFLTLNGGSLLPFIYKQMAKQSGKKVL